MLTCAPTAPPHFQTDAGMEGAQARLRSSLPTFYSAGAPQQNCYFKTFKKKKISIFDIIFETTQGVDMHHSQCCLFSPRNIV
jgi:hypothetical protein